MTTVSSRRVLDQVHTRAQLDALAAEPGTYAARVAAELEPAPTLTALEARDAHVQGCLADIDAMIARAMRIELDLVLADDTSLAAPTRKVFATTVLRYAADLSLLAERVREQALRGRARDADAIADAVVGAARRVLALWEQLRGDVLALVRDHYAASVELAARHATDRELDTPVRTRWSAARRELEATAAEPARIASAPWPQRLASWPEQLDEPAPAPEVSFADMIELD